MPSFISCHPSLFHNQPFSQQPDLSNFPTKKPSEKTKANYFKIARFASLLEQYFQSHLTLPVLTSPHLTSPHITSPRLLNRHYKWALGQIFDVFKLDSIIIVEDDLEIAVVCLRA